MATRHKLDTSLSLLGFFGPSRPGLAGLAYLAVMDLETNGGTDTDVSAVDAASDPLGPVLSLAELADRLDVSVQTLYDLRSQGRGPHGFRVGRHLRFRLSEIDAWLARMEETDADRHANRDRR